MALNLLLRKQNNQQENSDKTEQELYRDDLLKQYFHHERYGVIAKDTSRWRGHPERGAILQEVAQVIDDRFALVP